MAGRPPGRGGSAFVVPASVLDARATSATTTTTTPRVLDENEIDGLRLRAGTRGAPRDHRHRSAQIVRDIANFVQSPAVIRTLERESVLAKRRAPLTLASAPSSKRPRVVHQDTDNDDNDDDDEDEDEQAQAPAEAPNDGEHDDGNDDDDDSDELARLRRYYESTQTEQQEATQQLESLECRTRELLEEKMALEAELARYTAREAHRQEELLLAKKQRDQLEQRVAREREEAKHLERILRQQLATQAQSLSAVSTAVASSNERNATPCESETIDQLKRALAEAQQQARSQQAICSTLQVELSHERERRAKVEQELAATESAREEAESLRNEVLVLKSTAVPRSNENHANVAAELDRYIHENRKLKAHNTLLSQRSENIESLKNEVATLESQLSRANQQIQSLQGAIDEHSRYTEERRRWQEMLADTPQFQSVGELTKYIQSLQQEQLRLRLAQGNIDIERKLLENQLEQSNQQVQAAEQRVEALELKTREQQIQLLRTKGELELAQRENQALGRFLETLDKEDKSELARSVMAEPVELKQRLQVAESRVAELEQAQERLMALCERVRLEGEHHKSRFLALEYKVNTGTTKILHMTANPESKALATASGLLKTSTAAAPIAAATTTTMATADSTSEEQIEQLKSENDKLSMQLSEMQHAAAAASAVGLGGTSEQDQAALVALREQIDSLKHENIKLNRIKDFCRKKIQEFRAVCKQLFGWQIDVLEKRQYRIRSTYTQESDYLLFQDSNPQSPSHELDLLDSPYTSSVSEQLMQTLASTRSIPIFLAHLLVEQFQQAQEQGGHQ